MTPPQRVVVLGGGSAGLAAAVSAAVEGAQVTLLEAAASLGGTTATSGGAIWLTANPWSAAFGIDDSEEAGLRYLAPLIAVGDGDEEMSTLYVREGVQTMREIEERTGITWQHMIGFTDYHVEYEGGKEAGRGLEMAPIEVPLDAIARVRSDPYTSNRMTINEATRAVEQPDTEELERRVRDGVVVRGAGLIAALYASLVRLGGRALTDRRAIRLQTGDGGRVTGVVAEGETFEGEVIIACGGFERNDELVRTFLRASLDAPAGPPTNQGDGLRHDVQRARAGTPVVRRRRLS
jgi:3-oxosteroid 1-dehydrogenase